MEGTNFIFYPRFQQNHPGDWEICSPEGWELAPKNTEAAAGFHMADRGRLLPSSGPTVAAGSPPPSRLLSPRCLSSAGVDAQRWVTGLLGGRSRGGVLERRHAGAEDDGVG